jgi:TRAP-type transport system periplasmic protein
MKLKFGLMTATLALSASAMAQTKWDLPAAYPASNFHTENLAQFANDVDKASGGKLKIAVHANASLFKANEIKRAVQGGQAPIGEVLLVNFENENPIYGADGIPFLAASYAESKKLAAAQKPVLDKLLAAQGMMLLYTVPWPPQGIYVKKEISSVADMRGLKWRAYSPATGKIAELIGAQPVTIQAAELSQALATGAIETFATSSATGYDSKAWEQVKNFYNVNMSLPKNLVVVNEKAFAALDQPTQAAVLKAASAAEERGWKSSEDKNKWYLEQLAKNGMKIHQPSRQFQGELKKIGETMLNDWLKQAGAEGKSIIDVYRK